jgi:hypothetical protein
MCACLPNCKLYGNISGTRFEKTNSQENNSASHVPYPVHIHYSHIGHCSGSVGCFYLFLLALIQSLDRTSGNPNRLVLPYNPYPSNAVVRMSLTATVWMSHTPCTYEYIKFRFSIYIFSTFPCALVHMTYGEKMSYLLDEKWKIQT